MISTVVEWLGVVWEWIKAIYIGGERVARAFATSMFAFFSFMIALVVCAYLTLVWASDVIIQAIADVSVKIDEAAATYTGAAGGSSGFSDSSLIAFVEFINSFIPVSVILAFWFLQISVRLGMTVYRAVKTWVNVGSHLVP